MKISRHFVQRNFSHIFTCMRIFRIFTRENLYNMASVTISSRMAIVRSRRLNRTPGSCPLLATTITTTAITVECVSVRACVCVLLLTPENGNVILVGQEFLQLLGIDLLDDGLRFERRRRRGLRSFLISAIHISGKTQCQQRTHEQCQSFYSRESHLWTYLSRYFLSPNYFRFDLNS